MKIIAAAEREVLNDAFNLRDSTETIVYTKTGESKKKVWDEMKSTKMGIIIQKLHNKDSCKEIFRDMEATINPQASMDYHTYYRHKM